MNLDDFASPQPTKIWETSIPSKSQPGIAYTLIAYSDGTYDCNCPGRSIHNKCRHIKGAVMMLEGREIFSEIPMEKSTAAMTKPKKFYTLKEFITGRRQHKNSMITWYDEEFQAKLGETLHDVLELIIQRPGLTRNDYVELRGGVWNHTAPRITDLKDLELVYEDGNVQGPSGKPRSKLYPSDFIVYGKAPEE